MIRTSRVEGHEGDCVETWLNTNRVDMIGNGHFRITGFFKNTRKTWFGTIKTGKEFHGGITKYGSVESTNGLYH